MKTSPLVLLLFAMLGCDSGTQPAKTPAESGGNQTQDVPEQPGKPDAKSGGNQTQQQKAVTTDKQAASSAEKVPDAAAAPPPEVIADGGYEANVLPGQDGWVEAGSSFLGDFVTVGNGIMTYDATTMAASGAAGMAPAKIPELGGPGTLEYRFRCRAIGGDPNQWYQAFMGFNFDGPRHGIGQWLGHHETDEDQKVWGSFYIPEEQFQAGPPTNTGRWDANEWITVRYIFRDAGAEKYHLESWMTGPGGKVKYVDGTANHPGARPRLNLTLNSTTCKGAIFDLDYIRWSCRAVPYGTALEAVPGAPEVSSIHPRNAPGDGTAALTIKGGRFGAAPAVTFGPKAARAVELVDPYTVKCLAPKQAGTGWVDVAVHNAIGKTTLPNGFFYGRLPAITAVTPEKGGNQGGQRVAIHGSDFQAGAKVKFGRQEAAEVRVVDSASIVCRTAATQGGWSGVSDVIVTNADGGFVKAERAYTFGRAASVEPMALGCSIELHDYNLPVAIAKLEEMPFHGVILRPQGSLKLGRGNFSEALAQQNIAILKKVDFRRFKNNLLYASLTGFKQNRESVGFFEDWSGVIAGYRRYGRICREIECLDGLWLDVENYGGKESANLNSASYRDKGKSLAQCKKQVKLRARQIMTALLSQCPDIKVMTTFGLGAGTNSSLDLLPAFVDGMLEAVASDKAFARAQVVDGFEHGYYITTPEDFRGAYDRMRRPGGIAYGRTTLPQAWARHGAAAFGVWPDAHDLSDFKTEFTSAMDHTDQYVWVYTNGSFFMVNGRPTLGRNQRAKRTDQYIRAIADVTGLPWAALPGRCRTIGYWRMEKGAGSVVPDTSGLGFDGRLSDAGIWTNEHPALPKALSNRFALDFRGNRHVMRIDAFNPATRTGYDQTMKANHLGNLYFTDHTIEFSFWWNGTRSAEPQYLYGATGGRSKDKSPNKFGYGGWIPGRSRKFVHWQRGNWGQGFGGVEIDLERAAAAGAYRFGQWAHVAIKVGTIDSRNWKIFLNGKHVTGQDWAGVYKNHQIVEGFETPRGDGKFYGQYFPLALVIGAHNTEGRIVQHFDGMLDEFRITTGQLPTEKLLSVQSGRAED